MKVRTNMKITKIAALFLGLMMLLSLFTACDMDDPKAMQANAALKLLEAPYIMTMKMNYSCDDEEINQVLQGLSSESEMSMNVDGKNFILQMKTYGQKVEYVFADNVLYIDMMGIKMKSEVGEEDIDEVIDISASNFDDLSVDAFSSVKTNKRADGSVEISCKGFTSEANEMISSLLESLEAIGDTTKVEIDKKKFEYVVVIGKDGRYESISMFLIINIDVDGDKLAVKYDASMTFNYEDAVKVNAPADADDYFDAGDFGGLG